MKYIIVAQIGSKEDWSWEEVSCTNNWKQARNLAEKGARIFVGNKQVWFLGKSDKKDIDFAINVLAFQKAVDYELYLSVLTPAEEEKETKDVKTAKDTAKRYNITDEDIEKHCRRELNVVYEPMRFIDKPHFVAIDEDELPF